MKLMSKDINQWLENRQKVRNELIHQHQRSKERWQKAGYREEHLIAEVEAAGTAKRIFKEDFREIDNQLAKFDLETECFQTEALINTITTSKTIH